MPTTTNLNLPLMAGAQSQKHVTHNEALLSLDAIVQLSVISASLTTPPASPVDGARYIIGSSATGAWAGKDLNVTYYSSGSWVFLVPRIGWAAYNEATSAVILWTGAAWVDYAVGLGFVSQAALNSGTLPGQLTILGLGGATADTTNRLSINTPQVLFNHNGGSISQTINKFNILATGSIIYKTNFSGRAETGLVGNDRYAVKVSTDGAAWKFALDIDNATGIVSVPNGLLGDRASFRNRIINAGFVINQRGVSGTVTLTAGAYGHDRWKAGATGCTYTFATINGITTLTITAGTLLQIVEDSMIAEGGIYTVSWVGTAQARVYQGAASGSYISGPFQTGTLTAAINTTLEFSTGTVSKTQLELGVIATAFETRPAGLELLLCQRYYYQTKSGGNTVPRIGSGLCFNGTIAEIIIGLPVTMRALPTFGQIGSFYLFAANGALLNVTSFSGYAGGITPCISTQVNVASGLVSGNVTHLIGNGASTALTFDSEL